MLGVTLETIPNPTPYLQAPPGQALPPAPGGNLKVGLAWAGNSQHHQDATRSIPLRGLGADFAGAGGHLLQLATAGAAR